MLLGTQPEDKPIRESLVIGKSIRSGPWKYIEGREPVLFMRPAARLFRRKTNRPASSTI